MKKLILLAAIAMAMVAYQPVNAQININVNIGSGHYQPVRHNSYHYVPMQRMYYPRTVVVHRSSFVPAHAYRTNYSRKAYHYYGVKNKRQYGESHFKARGRGRH